MKFKGSYFSYVLTMFSYYFAMGIFGSIISIYLEGLGKSSSEISLVISGSHIFAFAMIPLVSFIHDKSKRKNAVTITALVLSAVTGIVFALSRQTFLLFIFNGLSMSFLQCVMPVCEQICSSGKYRYGTVRVWGAVGYAVSAQTAGIIYQYIAPYFLFVLFAVSVAATIIGFLGTKGMKGQYEKKDVQDEYISAKEDKYKQLAFWKNKNFILFLAASFIFAGITGLNSAYLPLLLVERGQTVSQAGTVLFVSTLMEIPLILLSCKFMDKFKDKTLMLTAFCMLMLQFAVYGFTTVVVPIVLASLLLKSVSTMLYIMITMKIVVNVVDDKYVVSALGVSATIKSLGSVIFQNLGGLFIEDNSLEMFFIALTGFALLGFLISLAIKIKSSKVIFQ